jgi:hypothetical protein
LGDMKPKEFVDGIKLVVTDSAVAGTLMGLSFGHSRCQMGPSVLQEVAQTDPFLLYLAPLLVVVGIIAATGAGAREHTVGGYQYA